MDCDICVSTSEHFVACPSCKKSVCTDCVKSYLISQLVARCMQCSVVWSDLTIRTLLPKAWIESNYKDHCKKILMDLETSYLPSSMHLVKAYRSLDLVTKSYQDFLKKDYKKITEWNEEKMELVKERSKSSPELKADLTDDIEILTKRITNAKITRNTYLKNLEMLESQLKELQDSSFTAHSLRFVVPCVKDKCRGFLDELYICGLCSAQVCRDCRFEITSKSHVCKDSDVESVKTILACSKPCPKCGVRTQKSMACDHMFCVLCKASWNWTTCKIIDHSTNSNPLFRAWLETESEEAKKLKKQLFHDYQWSIDRVKTFEDAKRHLSDIYFGKFFNSKVCSVYFDNYINVFNTFDNVVDEIEVALSEFGSCEYGPDINNLVRVKYLCEQIHRTEFAASCYKNYKNMHYVSQLRLYLIETQKQLDQIFKQFILTLLEIFNAYFRPYLDQIRKIEFDSFEGCQFDKNFRTVHPITKENIKFPIFPTEQIVAILQEYNKKAVEQTKIYDYDTIKFLFTGLDKFDKIAVSKSSKCPK